MNKYQMLIPILSLLTSAFVMSHPAAQSAVTVHQPVQGLFVRGTDVGQFEEESGIVNTDEGTWSVIQIPFLSASPRPLWSPNGQEIAFRFVGKYAGIVDISDDTITFTTESVESALNVPFDTSSIRGWSADGQSLAIDSAQVGSLSSLVKLYDVDLVTHTVQEIRQWQTGEQVTEMPLPPDATSVQLNGGYLIKRNPVFDDWLTMQFDGSGYYSTFNIGEPVSADINVLWNFRTNEYISLDALVPDLWISRSQGDWSHDGTRLLLSAVSKDLLNSYIVTFRFTPEQGIALVDRVIVENRTPQHWLDAGDLFFSLIQDYDGGAAYVLGEIVDGEYRETPFFSLNGQQFDNESFGDWFMRADEDERNRLSCLFEWQLPARLTVGDSAQIVGGESGSILYSSPDRFSTQIGTLSQGTIVTVVGGDACSSGYRWWQVQLGDGSTGWIIEAEAARL